VGLAGVADGVGGGGDVGGVGEEAGAGLEEAADQLAALDTVSAPELGFPVHYNRELAPSLAFAGATVDGTRTTVLPLLTASANRY
jgi:hypothetical protein